MYGNRNFLPFYYEDMSNLEGGHEAKDGYSGWNASYIIDGSGVYITRNQIYEGHMELAENICFDNGINGVVVHKTNHANVRVTVRGNTLFDNGRTVRGFPEYRQNAGGLVINMGKQVSLRYNKVLTSVSADDQTFQCFGTCELDLATSEGNVGCNGAISNKYNSAVFASNPAASCAELSADAVDWRACYITSTAPKTPQYAFFPGFTPPPPTPVDNEEGGSGDDDNSGGNDGDDRNQGGGGNGTSGSSNGGGDEDTGAAGDNAGGDNAGGNTVGGDGGSGSGGSSGSGGDGILLAGAVAGSLAVLGAVATVFLVARRSRRRQERMADSKLPDRDSLSFQNRGGHMIQMSSMDTAVQGGGRALGSFDKHVENRRSFRPESLPLSVHHGRPSALRRPTAEESHRISHFSSGQQQRDEDSALDPASVAFIEQLDRETLEYYYYCVETGVAQWDKPGADQGTIQPSDWHVAEDEESGRHYFYNSLTGETQWVQAEERRSGQIHFESMHQDKEKVML